MAGVFFLFYTGSMKNTLIFALFFVSLNAFSQSAAYVCDVRNYRLEINLRADISTDMWLIDTFNRDVIAMGFAGSIEKKGDKSIYNFYPGNGYPVKLTFKTQDAIDFPPRISGHIDTRARGFLLWENLSCRRRN